MRYYQILDSSQAHQMQPTDTTARRQFVRSNWSNGQAFCERHSIPCCDSCSAANTGDRILHTTMARMGSSSFVASCLLLLSSCSLCVQAGTSDHRYKPAEHVELWVNKVRNVHPSSLRRASILVVFGLRAVTCIYVGFVRAKKVIDDRPWWALIKS
jgi:hypothetical protein